MPHQVIPFFGAGYPDYSRAAKIQAAEPVNPALGQSGWQSCRLGGTLGILGLTPDGFC